METFYDGYVVNAVMDACYRSMKSKRWEPVELEIWRGRDDAIDGHRETSEDGAYVLIKREILPDGRSKAILKEKATGKVVERVS
jgi:hypothetical protein